MGVQSHVSLQEDFFSRKQQDGETLQEFSHALMCLMEKVVQKSPHGSISRDGKEVLLRDQFTEHVFDCSLRRELKQFVRGHPAATLIDVRTEAIRWEQEGMSGGTRGRSHSVSDAYGYQCYHQGAGNSPFRSELSELKEILRNQQEQLNRLTESLTTLKVGHRNQMGHGRRTLVCLRCQKPGHFARECREDFAATHSCPTPVATQSQSRHALQDQETGTP